MLPPTRADMSRGNVARNGQHWGDTAIGACRPCRVMRASVESFIAAGCAAVPPFDEEDACGVVCYDMAQSCNKGAPSTRYASPLSRSNARLCRHVVIVAMSRRYGDARTSVSAQHAKT